MLRIYQLYAITQAVADGSCGLQLLESQMCSMAFHQSISFYSYLTKSHAFAYDHDAIGHLLS